MPEKIVITGLGVLAPNAKGKEDYWNALQEGRPGYGPVKLFDASEFNVNIAGEVPDFDATEYLGKKGLRTMDRATRLVVCAAKLLMQDAGYGDKISEELTDDFGVSVGTTLGSLKSIAEFDEVTLREGPRYVNPALFPNTVINAPASHISIWFNIQGFNSTLSNGFTTSIDAMEYGYDFIDSDRVKVVFGGGVEEMCWHTFFGFHTLKYLSGSKEGEPFVNCPFDKRRNGIVFGEGALLVGLEDLDFAKRRGAKIMADVTAFGYEFDPFRLHKFNPRAVGMKNSIRKALDEADMSPSDIDVIFANANSTQAADRIETFAIKEVFGAAAKKVPVTAIKSMIGETYSVSGAMAVGAALGAMERGFIPPTINYKEPDPECDLNIIANKAVKADIKNAMIMNFSPSGANMCMIIRKWED